MTPISASDFRLLTESEKYGLYAEAVRGLPSPAYVSREGVIEECADLVEGLYVRSHGLGSSDIAAKIRALKNAAPQVPGSARTGDSLESASADSDQAISTPAGAAPDTIKEMVRQSLEAGGFDGLYNPGECACKKDDLFPCGEPSMIGCHPGYLQPCGTDCSEHDWHIVKIKPSNDSPIPSISGGRST